MIRINVALRVKLENKASLLCVLRELAERSRQELGCVGYDIFEHCLVPERLAILETWESEERLAAHRLTEHFIRLVPQMQALSEEKRTEKFTDAPSIEEALLHRRSIRQFLPDKISRSVIERLIRAAMYAPTANHTQPWEFIVVESPSHLEGLSHMSPHAILLQEAPLAIIVCGNLRRTGRNNPFWPLDLAACTQNLLLQAYAEGLGAVWLGFYPRMERVDPIRTYFSLSDDWMPFAVVAVGKPAKKAEDVERFDRTKIHYVE